MKLKARFLHWFTGSPVVMLSKKTADEIGVPAKGRVLLKTISRKPLEIMAITDTIEHLACHKEIIVSDEIRKILKLKRGQKIEVILAQTPESTALIKKKLNNKTLSDKEIDIIVKDIVDNSLSDPEIALFVTAMYQQGMNTKETVSLIKSILKNGNKINFKNKLVVDKHSIGGVAGRTTPIVVSICAAAGLIMPKTSSRAITSAAGTADIMEAIADVDLSIDEIKKVIKKTNACIVWGGSLGLVPADDKIITIEKTLEIDPEAQLLSSIMAKKLAVGSNYIVIDIPYGRTAKVSLKKALHLKEKFENLGKYFHKKIRCLLVENTGPLGNGVGPALELIDVLKVLSREDPCYKLEERSLQLSGALLEMTEKAKKGKGMILAKKILDSKKALEKFKQIVKAQNGNLNRIKVGEYKKEVFAEKSGKVKEINNKNINSVARIAGSPYYKGAGIFIHVHEGEIVKKGDKLFTIYSESRTRINQALNFYKKNKIYNIT
jgi:AMP phosphorylase